MNSETVKPTPPRRFSKPRTATSVTPAIGDSTSGGLISTFLILKGFVMGRAHYTHDGAGGEVWTADPARDPAAAARSNRC
jgi:hypothetical protein